MTTAAQIHANRQNSWRSTGPRTEEGKARCRGNATRHGFFSRDLAAILAEGDPEEQESRRVRLNLMWHPKTGAEVDLVDRLAEIGDEKARATRFEREYLIEEARRAVLEAAARRSEEAREDGRRLLDAGEDVESGTDGAVERRSISPGVLLGRLEATPRVPLVDDSLGRPRPADRRRRGLGCE